MTSPAPCAPDADAGSRCRSALAAVRTAPTLLAGIRRTDRLVALARRHPREALPVLSAALAAAEPDQLAVLAAVHGLAAVPGPGADAALAGLLGDPRPWVREHTAWRLAERHPLEPALVPLTELVAAGGFPGMLAQRTLQAWAPAAPEAVLAALARELDRTAASAARARLTETAGLVPGRAPAELLLGLAGDAAQDDAVRAAALDALADRHEDDPAGVPELPALAARCARGTGSTAAVARTVLAGPPALPGPGDGLTVLQVFLHAEIDRDLTFSGRGDNGGIATLLAQLGDALTARRTPGGRGVSRVLTVSRGTHDAPRPAAGYGSGHVLTAVPLPGPPVALAEAWPRRVAAERGLRRLLRAAGPVDVVHLRMADVGSLAAAAAAAELGVPTVLTAAPDPHALIAAREAAATLDRENFGAADHAEHLWFRVRLLADLAAGAARLVLLPRPDLARNARELLGLGPADTARSTTVPEGIDLAVLAAADETAAAGTGPELAALDAVLGTLPPQRRGLPLLVTVGRLHRVKGSAALVEAWAGDEHLRARCNLLLVGGDLADPSADEREQLARIDAVLPRDRAAAGGLLLAGHRPHGTVAVWLAAVRRGRPGLAAGCGAYVCASLKEEFGVALVEALAAGLPVVAPRSGGPATYVADGVTGVLADTADPAALAMAAGRVLDLAAAPTAGRAAAAAAATVRERFSVEEMAAVLTTVYDRAAAARGRRAP
ncbi:glycosyltransferase [Kocuria flava]|uniref:glycosyltransferase n=1 Tax=Kocuria flava TaxID=446860 RepID=UPI001FF6F4A3|nr:glycosyltransferase [Kocuria flava]MCJ8505730.1 glycosyltransferase [Kocuria flava]